MSGHSKWSTIKRKKGALDAKRGKIFTKLIKEITVAARTGGGDPGGNPRLRLAVDNAKAQNMPNDNIDRAIKKATGDLEGVNYLELNYEGYGPAGVAVIVECLTDNKNRSVAGVRHAFNKLGGSLGENGSVAWMFEHKGIIVGPAEGKDEEAVMEAVLDADPEDISVEEDFFELTSSLEGFETLRKAAVDASLTIENASLQWVAKNRVDVEGETIEKIEKLIDMLEDLDDVQYVYTNADFKEE